VQHRATLPVTEHSTHTRTRKLPRTQCPHSMYSAERRSMCAPRVRKLRSYTHTHTHSHALADLGHATSTRAAHTRVRAAPQAACMRQHTLVARVTVSTQTQGQPLRAPLMMLAHTRRGSARHG
jgi:hypothetical protein